MVDEYQDTDSFQKDFLITLNRAGSNIMAVGDDFQSIYAFRGANYKNILLFKKDFTRGKLIKFQNNFRSSKEIVKFITSITDKISNKIEKNSFAIKSSEKKPKVITVNTLEDEGEYIAISIRKILSEKDFHGTIGILYRNKHLVNHIEKGLDKYSVEYNKIKEENRENKIIENFLNFYNFFIRPEGFNIEKIRLKLDESKEDKQISTWELVNFINKVKFIKKNNLKNGEKNRKNSNEVEYNRIIDEIESKLYKKIVRGYIEFITEVSEQNKIDLLFYLYLSINSKKMNLEEMKEVLLCNCKNIIIDELKIKKVIIKKEEKKQGKVDLLTVHSSKGLEWDYLFVATVVEGVYPRERFQNTEYTKCTKNNISNKENELYIDEERRVFYVACSRAKRDLTITIPKRIHWFNKDFEGISRFLTEIESENYDFLSKEI